MNCMKYRWLIFCLQVPLLAQAAVNDSDLELFSLESLYGDEEFVSIATGTKKPIYKAPSVATVITSDDIEAMGATSLGEVLETVPGLHVSYSSHVSGPRFFFRGISSSFGPQALLLINEVPIKSSVKGDSFSVWGRMPVQSIERIEVVRGPGSAIYGADAFSGVINIITKKYSHSNTFGLRVASHNTNNSWLSLNKALGELEIALNAEYLSSDGDNHFISQDGIGQSGYTNNQFESLDVYFDARYKDYYLNLSWLDRNNVGTGQGLVEVLDPQGRFGSERLIGELGIKNHRINEQWTFSAKASYFYANQTVQRNIHLLPAAGYTQNAMIGNPEWWEQSSRFESRIQYHGLTKHEIMLGLGAQYIDLYRTHESKNFNTDLSPKASLEDVSSDPAEIFMPTADRSNYFIFIQDEYQLAPDWEITAGLRLDEYSDFGTTLNPRLALVWSTSLNLTTKFLYGRAFRAPSFAELVAQSNPSALGNPNLSPEQVDTYELAFNYKPTPEFNLSTNIFFLKTKNNIDFVSSESSDVAVAQNLSGNNGHGIELSASYDLSNSTTLTGIYAQNAIQDKQTNLYLGQSPNKTASINANVELTNFIDWSTTLHYIGSQKRLPSEQYLENRRPPVRASQYVNTHLSFALSKQVQLMFSAKNIFNSKIREPSEPLNLSSFNLIEDIPLHGRSFWLGFKLTDR